MADFFHWPAVAQPRSATTQRKGLRTRSDRVAHLEDAMKKPMAIGAVVIVLATALDAATAADIQRSPGYYSAPAPYPVYNWVGPYIGANLGYQWGSATQSGADPSGFVGGIQGGFNWQVGQFVYGLETDLQRSAADDTFANWKFSNPWFGTARARAGMAMNNILLYATLGIAYGDGKVETGALSETRTHVGWTGGAGIEVGLTPNWSAKAEYLYVDLSDQRYVLFGNTGFESNILRLGVNYRF
jgi:outer membrane immunogenic protein